MKKRPITSFEEKPQTKSGMTIDERMALISTAGPREPKQNIKVPPLTETELALKFRRPGILLPEVILASIPTPEKRNQFLLVEDPLQFRKSASRRREQIQKTLHIARCVVKARSMIPFQICTRPAGPKRSAGDHARMLNNTSGRICLSLVYGADQLGLLPLEIKTEDGFIIPGTACKRKSSGTMHYIRLFWKHGKCKFDFVCASRQSQMSFLTYNEVFFQSCTYFT